MVCLVKIKTLKSGLILPTVLTVSLGAPSFASADSGSSTLPTKDSGLHAMYYKMYAPKSQTKYKQFSVAIQKVNKINKDNNKLILYGGLVAGGGNLVTQVNSIKNMPYVGTALKAVTSGGTAMALVGTYGKMTYSKFKKDSLIMHKTYFKWTNASRLEYSVKIESWATYKGKPVSKVKVSTFSKSL
ncbi:hypothetical protein RSA11_12895 [Exiguobacterium indicum]|uniref:Uncharacterized protein n=1 Tax=Exiguobacterium indicum TaxID=296995 RepID=A0AAW3M922_9BACL|nr:hypothetical protein RSA11_12895 [Exiguobacterium indicum]